MMMRLALAASLCASVAVAQVPLKLGYQGRLLQADGTAVVGVENITFALFASANSASPLWSETQSVAVTNGFYSVHLGDVTPLSATLFDGTELFLQLTIGGQPLLPRERVASTPYAVKAGVARDVEGGSVRADSLTVGGTAFSSTDGGVSLGGALAARGLTSAGAVSVAGPLTASGAITGATLVATSPTGPGPVPPGAIMMWSGTLATIPTGWLLCDGTNGTPDLRDRFIAGTSAGVDPGGTGGVNSVALTVGQLPAHNHPLTVDPVGNHTHGISIPWTGAPVTQTVSYAGSTGGSSLGTVLTEQGGAHAHTGTVGNTGSGQTFDNRPAFYKLAFIIKR